jgi:hypothetical protein
MLNGAPISSSYDGIVTLEGALLNQAIARILGYQPWAELPLEQRHAFRQAYHQTTWFEWTADSGYQPVPQDKMNFATEIALAAALPLCETVHRFEDWIHVERGGKTQWVIRLVRLSRGTSESPWQREDLYVADGRKDDIPMATAYGRAWLLSHWACPPPKVRRGSSRDRRGR